ncbi:PREDICTED: uncharacterized protein LOC105964197 [Erythranthe guttata]|uniref:uncharacterized protein LOC105964197 n=1 Tax=Erythranthe guttata TaxID=4155 RepID=UPI00064D7B44|nr:PREDICTED: uncharacterized protein LOC105964197 [Erythranthe guttata]|eukprot:XP_012844177.1 PREDICTED: uncharacterized protein LOC105964197 [Erythranthe guttata]
MVDLCNIGSNSDGSNFVGVGENSRRVVNLARSPGCSNPNGLEVSQNLVISNNHDGSRVGAGNVDTGPIPFDNLDYIELEKDMLGNFNVDIIGESDVEELGIDVIGDLDSGDLGSPPRPFEIDSNRKSKLISENLHHQGSSSEVPETVEYEGRRLKLVIHPQGGDQQTTVSGDSNLLSGTSALQDSSSSEVSSCSDSKLLIEVCTPAARKKKTKTYLKDIDSFTCASMLRIRRFNSIVASLGPFGKLCQFPEAGDRMRAPPIGFFTVYSDWFKCGFKPSTLPVVNELVKVTGLSISQFYPNTFTIFAGFIEAMRQVGQPISVDAFHASFMIKKGAMKGSFYFKARSHSKFLLGGSRSRGPWAGDFFFMKDDGWDISSVWGSTNVLEGSTGSRGSTWKQLKKAGLFKLSLNAKEIALGVKVSAEEIRRLKSSCGVTARANDLPNSSSVPSGDVAGKRKRSSSPDRADAARDVRRGAPRIPFTKKSHELTRTNASKQKKDDGSSSSGISVGKGLLFVSSVVDSDMSGSLWDVENPRAGCKLIRGAISDLDMKRLGAFSDLDAADFMGSDIARVVTGWTGLRKRLEDYKRAVDVIKDSEEKAVKAKVESDARAEMIAAEMKIVKEAQDKTMAALKSMTEKYFEEKQTGAFFLASDKGKKFLEQIRKQELERYHKEEFARDATLASVDLYDEVVLMCQRQLRETGRVSEDVINLLGQDISEPSIVPSTKVIPFEESTAIEPPVDATMVLKDNSPPKDADVEKKEAVV